LDAPPQEPQFKVEPLGSNHDRAAFSCGTSVQLDQYLKTQARQDMVKKLAAVFILTADSKTIAGYYTLSSYFVRLDQIPEEIARKLTRHPEVPSTLIGRLARDINFRGKGIGEILLIDALKRSLENTKQVASWAVVVDAKDQNAVDFYLKYGFTQIPTVPNRLFLSMATIEKTFA
jgi:predicted GNAT family N-acyltransferase